MLAFIRMLQCVLRIARASFFKFFVHLANGNLPAQDHPEREQFIAILILVVLF